MKNENSKLYYQFSTSDFFIDGIGEKKDTPIDSIYLGVFDTKTCEKIIKNKNRKIISFAYSKRTNDFNYSKPYSSYNENWLVLSKQIDESLVREFVRMFDIAHNNKVPSKNNYAYMQQKFNAFFNNKKLLKALVLTECLF